MKRSDNLTGKATYAYYFPRRVFHPKKLIPHCTTNNAHVRGSVHVILRENSTLSHGPALNLEILRRNAAVGSVPVLIAKDHLNRIVHIRRYALDQRHLVLDGDCIGHNQRLCIVGACAHPVDRAASGFNPDEIVSEIVELLFDTGLSRFADGYDADYRRNPDGDPQDR